MTNAWRVSEARALTSLPSLHLPSASESFPSLNGEAQEPSAEKGHSTPSPLVGEGGSGAKRRGRVRGNAGGLTKRQLLPPGTVKRSRALRRNATDAELKLWRALREAFPHAKFRSQVPLGIYHADFCSHRAKLVIEVDGGQHATATEKDDRRTRFIEGEGYRVLRFWNNDVLANIDGVIAAINIAVPFLVREDSPAPSDRRGTHAG